MKNSILKSRISGPLAVLLAQAVLRYDREKLRRGKASPVRRWAIRLLVWGAT